MSHDLDVTNGVASFASAREHAWHKLGNVLPNAMTAEEALEAANLARWNIRKEPLTVQQEPILTENGVTPVPPLEVPGKFATVRTNPVDGTSNVLGVVGNSYTVIQNEEHAELLNTLVDESGAHFETAGALRGGSQVFLSMKLPQHIEIQTEGVVDRTDLYLVAMNSHDGSSSFRLLVTPVRVVCANTARAALGAAKSQFAIQHTRNAKRNIQLAREALGMTFTYAEEFERQMQALQGKPVRESEAEEILRRAFGFDPAPATIRTENNQLEKIGSVMRIWKQEPTNVGARQTAYGLFNAVTEYVDHFSTVYGDGRSDMIRAERAAIGSQQAKLKDATFQLLSV